MLHHLIWEEANGPIPEGKEIHHICHNRGCQNINHLECIDGSLHATITNNEREFKIGEWKRNGTS
jgi:glutamine cyclotransferase